MAQNKRHTAAAQKSPAACRRSSAPTHTCRSVGLTAAPENQNQKREPDPVKRLRLAAIGRLPSGKFGNRVQHRIPAERWTPPSNRAALEASAAFGSIAAERASLTR